MAGGLNRVMLLGHLGADPELRFGQSGTAVLNMRLATTESYLDRNNERKERTDWHSIVIFGKRAEALGKILQKGSGCLVEGSLRTESYEKDGEKRYATKVYASNVILTGGRGRQEDGGERSSSEQTRGGRGGGRVPAPQGGGGGHSGGYPADGFGDDSDIPF